MEAVSLDELNGAAALQTRVDRKYLIDNHTLDWLAARLVGRARVLEIGGRRRFGYESVYFDAPALLSYHDAARSRPSRFKVRTRSYVDADRHFVEVKVRNRGRQTVKTRRPVDPSARATLNPTARAFAVDAVRHELGGSRAAALAEVVEDLIPTLQTRFGRTTLMLEPPANHHVAPLPARATIDTALEFDIASGRKRAAADLFIVESKSSGPPSAVDRLLWSAGHRPLSFSKYGCGLALLLPHLPASKWNRVLRHHFVWEPSRSP
jgi:hypothetical protein